MASLSSDTTGGARKVAIEAGLSENGDCCMHLGSLLLAYGLGCSDNQRSVTLPNKDKVVVVVTPGLCNDDGCVENCQHGACDEQCMSWYRPGHARSVPV